MSGHIRRWPERRLILARGYGTKSGGSYCKLCASPALVAAASPQHRTDAIKIKHLACMQAAKPGNTDKVRLPSRNDLFHNGVANETMKHQLKHYLKHQLKHSLQHESQHTAKIATPAASSSERTST